MKLIDSPIAFREMIYSFQPIRIVLTAYELDVFSQIALIGNTAEEVAAAINSNPRATERLMNSLCAIGFLGKNDDLYYNSAFTAKFLSKKSPDYLRAFHHTLNMWDTWSTLTEVVKTGKSQRDKVPSRKREDWSEAFIGAMHERAALNAKDVITKIPLRNSHKMIDIGGGSGVYSMEFVRLNEQNNATVFDLPGIIDITRKYVDEEGLSGKFSYLSGDYNHDDFGKGYDVAFLSAIVHINSYDENQSLINKCYNSLNNEGLCVIQDHLMSEDRTHPYAGALFAINMLVGTESGDTYTEGEITEWLTHAGFKDIIRIETYNNGMMIGRKRV